MSGSQPAPGPDGGRQAGEPGQPGHPVTGLLASDTTILMLARQVIEDGGGSPAAVIAARRDLDRELNAMRPWPTGRDYQHAAADYERMGRTGDAALLRRIAAADTLIAQARTGWNTRYDARPATPATQMAYRMRDAGIIDFDPAGPYAGADGAAYEPGACTKGGKPEPILVITGRGGAEFLTGWTGFDAMTEWAASRGSTGSGPLVSPPVPGGCRAWAEDQVLARLVTSPRDVPGLSAALPPDTFTTDVRYEAFQSVLALARRGTGYYTPDQVAAELTTRMAALPPHAQVNYGGAGGAPARAYLARLAATEVTRGTAASAVATLVAEDQRCRPHPEPAASPACASSPAAGGHPRKAVAPVSRPGLPQPQPLPGSSVGPVPRL